MVRLARHRIACRMGRNRVATVRRHWFATLVSLGLLGGTSMFPIVSYLSAQPAAADASAVIPDSAFGGFTSVMFGPSDDGSWPCGPSDASGPVACTGAETGPAPFPFGFNINFYGTEYSGAYVNTNGNITFGTYLTTFTPFGLTTGGIPAIIAPFFADVDTRPIGSNIMEIGTGTLDGHNAFMVKWPGVGCYNQDQTVADDFQVILIDRPDLGTGLLGDDFQIEFNYDSIQWDAGQASGGTNTTPDCQSTVDDESAVVGFSNGTATPGDSFQLTGSQSDGAFLDSNPTTGLINNDLNSSVLGRYVFSVHNGQPLAPTSVATSLSGGSQSGTNITVPTGTAVTDSASLSGTNASTATGTVTYNVYSDSACTAAVSTGSPEAITTPGVLPDSSPYTVATAGTYYWQAVYSGDDATANAPSMSTCGSETVAALAPTSVATSLSGGGQTGTNILVPTGTAVTDSATLSGTNVSTATGTVTYNVYSDSGCTTFAPGGAGTAEAIATEGTLPDSSPYSVSTSANYYWQASYSGDALNEASVSTCGSETVSAVTFGQPPPPPPPPPPPTLRLPTPPPPPTPTPPTPTPPTPTPPTPFTPTPFTPIPRLPTSPLPLTPKSLSPTFKGPGTVVLIPPASPTPVVITPIPQGQLGTLTLSRSTVIPGEATTASGDGCAAGSPVTLSINGTTVGATTANEVGAFSASIKPTVAKAGQVTVTATCGSTTLATLLALVTTSTVSAPEGGAAILGVFVLVGFVLLRGQFTSNGTRRRRRRGAADVLAEQD